MGFVTLFFERGNVEIIIDIFIPGRKNERLFKKNEQPFRF